MLHHHCVVMLSGHVEVVRFLTKICRVNPFVKDRWGNSPLDDAMQFGHSAVIELLQEYQKNCSDTQTTQTAEESSKLKSVEGMV